jgi:hypothetical protein
LKKASDHLTSGDAVEIMDSHELLSELEQIQAKVLNASQEGNLSIHGGKEGGRVSMSDQGGRFSPADAKIGGLDLPGKTDDTEEGSH